MYPLRRVVRYIAQPTGSCYTFTMNSTMDKAPPKSLHAAVRTAFGLLFSAVSAFFFWVFYERFYRHEFNELGRYYDAETETVYTSSGFIWILPALFFLLPGILLLVFRKK